MAQRHNRRLRAQAALVAVVFATVAVVPAPARASIFGEENATLIQIATLQLQEVLKLGELINNAELVLRGVNEGVAVAREARRIYDMIVTYTPEQLLEDAWEGLTRAYPELRDLHREIGVLGDNMELLKRDVKGERVFWNHVDIHSHKARKVVESGTRLAYRSAIWPVAFPKAMRFEKNPSPVELLIQNRYHRAGMQHRRAVQNIVLGKLVDKTAALVKDAENKGRADLVADGLNAHANVQNANNTTTLKDLAELMAAREELAELAAKKMKEAAAKELGEGTGLLVGGPGSIK